MGGKGGGGGGNNIPRRPMGQQSDRSAGPSVRRDALGRRQTGRDRRRPDRPSQPQQMPAMPGSQRGPTAQDRLRMNPSEMAPMTDPVKKLEPLTPLPARVGVRQQRRPYQGPELAISAEEQKRLQQDIDTARGYGPTFAIDPSLLDDDGGGDDVLGGGPTQADWNSFAF